METFAYKQAKWGRVCSKPSWFARIWLRCDHYLCLAATFIPHYRRSCVKGFGLPHVRLIQLLSMWCSVLSVIFLISATVLNLMPRFTWRINGIRETLIFLEPFWNLPSSPPSPEALISCMWTMAKSTSKWKHPQPVPVLPEQQYSSTAFPAVFTLVYFWMLWNLGIQHVSQTQLLKPANKTSLVWALLLYLFDQNMSDLSQ